MATESKPIEDIDREQPGIILRPSDLRLRVLTDEEGNPTGQTILDPVGEEGGPIDLFGTTDPRLGTLGLEKQRYYRFRTPTLVDLYVYENGVWGEPRVPGFLLALPANPGAPLPEVSLTAVSTGTVGVAVQLSATATSTNSTITQVEFFVGAASQGVVLGSGPYGVSYTPTATGTFYLTAKATDANGQSKVSTPKIFVVNAPGTPVNLKPTVALTLTPDHVSVNQATTLSATANDPDGPAPSVGFYVSGKLVVTVTAPPYTTGYVPTTTGELVVDAVATDNKGASTTSSLTLTVVPQVVLITPDPPTQASDDAANTQDFDSPYGKNALLVSVGGAAFTAYAGPYNVGNVNRPDGYYQAKVAAAPGRAESAVTSSPAFTMTAVTVPGTLSSIVITGPASVNEGSSATYGVTGTYSDNTTAVITSGITWGSNTPGGVLTVASNAVTGDGTTATVTATVGAKSATKTVTIVDTTVVTTPTPTSPSYHGTTTSAAPTAAQLAALTSESWPAAARTISFDATANGNTGNYLVFVEPASYGIRTSITDADGDNVTGTFTRSTLTVNGVSCNAYITNLANYDNPAIVLTFATPS